MRESRAGGGDDARAAKSARAGGGKGRLASERVASLSIANDPSERDAPTMPPARLTLASDGETLVANLYGTLPAERAVILVHGSSWDASGWRDVAPRFVERGVPALAINLRGFGGSSGKTNRYQPGKPWSPVTDLRAAKAWLRDRGAREIALVGSSMGGSAVLASSFEKDVECVVAISAPVAIVPTELAKMITGRKLFICADRDSLRAAPNVRQCFDDANTPKTLLLFGGREHSKAIFTAPYAEEALDALVGFACRRG